MKRIGLISSFILFGMVATAQTVESAISKGNEFYKKEQFDLAENGYREALALNRNNVTAQYNLANALARQRKYDEAKKVLDGLLQNSGDKNLREAVYYNKGVVLTRQKELDASIEAYKAALRINPDDKEARENLQKALMERKQQQQKQKEQQQNQSQSSMTNKQAEQKLKSLQEKEKKIQERLQNKGQKGSSLPKDW
ncbi:MAG: tetratricopeptide repeat protein [Chitinophagaceae bacterium]